MKAIGTALPLLVLALANPAFAQNAKGSFEKLKALAGEWEGVVTISPADPSEDGKAVQVTIRVTSKGNALLHEIRLAGRSEDPITIFYLDSDRLVLTHYCDVGNRPRMVAKPEEDGKTISFEFLDVGGQTQNGYMHDAVFTVLGPDHHTEEWRFRTPNSENGEFRAHMDLLRKK